MDRQNKVGVPGRYHHRVIAKLLLLVFILFTLTTCGSNQITSPPTGNSQTPTISELTETLMAELARLGKDPGKTAAAAPSGSDNAVFDLSARIIGDVGSREASSRIGQFGEQGSPLPGSGRAPYRPVYVTSNEDGLVQGTAPTQDWSANVPVCDPLGGTGGPPTVAGVCDPGSLDAGSQTRPTSAITGITLSWTERIIGDYDQNGEVNLADLTPLAINFSINVYYDAPALHGGFAAWPSGDPEGADATNWRMARIDGDSNGEIGMPDITPIAVHFQEVSHGYQIERAINYGTGTLDWEALPIDIGFGIQPSAPRDATANYTNDTPVRYSATVPLASPEFAHYFRVKPYDEISETVGELSNVVQYLPSPTEDTVPPYWLDTVGVTKLTPSNESITVEFGTATDDASLPVNYRIYWAEGDEAFPDAPFDYLTAQTMDMANSSYTIIGLTNDQYYRVAVRAMDSADTPNIEANTVLQGRRAGATDIYPPEWQGGAGLQDVYYGSGLALLFWNIAIDHHEDEFGVWENDPVIYRVYHGEGRTPDWQNAMVEEFTETELESFVVELNDIDTSQPHWYAVRVSDSAPIPNEDENAKVISVPGVTLDSIAVPPRSPEIPVEVTTAYGSKFVNSPNLQHTHYFQLWEVESTGEHWVERIRVSDPPATQRELFYFDNIGIGITEFHVDNAGNMSFIYRYKADLEGGQHLGYFIEEPEEMMEYGAIGGYENVGFNIDDDPFVMSTAYDFAGLNLISVEQSFINMKTGLKVVYHFDDEGSAQEIIDNTFVSSYPYAVLANGQIRFAGRLRGGSSDDPHDIFTFHGDSFTLVPGPAILPDGAVYYGSYGVGLDAPIDYYFSKGDPFDDVAHYVSGSEDVVIQAPKGITLTSRGRPNVIDIENFFVRHSHYYKAGFPEFPDLTVLYAVKSGEVINLLPFGVTNGFAFEGRGIGHDSNGNIVIGYGDEETPGLTGYQVISID